MHGSPPRPIISFCNWLKKDEFLKYKTKQYEMRLQALNEKLDQHSSGKEDKKTLYFTIHKFVQDELNMVLPPASIQKLSDQQCRDILQGLHASSDVVRRLLNDAPFQTVTNPFYEGRAQAKVAVLYAGCLDYLKAQGTSSQLEQSQQDNVSTQEVSPTGPRADQEPLTNEQSITQRVTSRALRRSDMHATSTVPLTSTVTVTPTPKKTVVSQPADFSQNLDGLVTFMHPLIEGGRTLSTFNYPQSLSKRDRIFLDSAITNKWLTKEVVAAAAREDQLSTVIHRLRHVIQMNTIKNKASLREPASTILSLFEMNPDNGSGLGSDEDIGRFSPSLRTLARAYLKSFADRAISDIKNPEMYAYGLQMRYVLIQLNRKNIFKSF